MSCNAKLVQGKSPLFPKLALFFFFSQHGCRLCINSLLSPNFGCISSLYILYFNLFFSGQMIDGPQNGLAPQPWDIPAQPSQLFTPQEALIEVPHTASVKVIVE